MAEDVKCPICGSETVERASKKGPNAGQSFYVCNRYPECKGKVEISGEEDVDEFLIGQEEKTEPPAETKPKRKLKRPAIGCLVVIGVIIIIGVIGSIVGIGDSTPSPTPTPTKPALTASEQTYATSVADQTDTLGEAFYELSDLTSNPQIGNDDWTWNVAIQLAIIRALYDEAMDLGPPNSMAAIHLKYIQAMENFNDATHLMAEGIDELDASLIDAATQKMNTGNQLINEATQLTLDFMESHK